MDIKRLLFWIAASMLLIGCGGGSSSSAPAMPPPVATGGFTLLVGDAPLDGIDAVNIDIEEVRLLGGDGQLELLADGVGVINLLDLRNITQLVATTDIPVGSYSKIRLIINSLEIVETGNPNPVAAQLPANGKIDLNPQGPFEISAGENLVVQIDFDLERSIQLVQTGNSQYRFRPVVFIDVIENLRLTRLFGSIQADAEANSDLDLCPIDVSMSCFDIAVADEALLLLADGSEVLFEDLMLPAEGHVFGHFFIGSAGGRFFRAIAVVQGAVDSVEAIDGIVGTVVVADAFDLIVDDALDPTSVQILAGAKVLDQNGATLTNDIAVGNEAEAWAQSSQLALAAVNEFPAFLIQVREGEDETSVAGTLIDLVDETLTVSNADGQFCVTVTSETDIQLLSDYNGDAESDDISLIALGDLISTGVEVEAFGDQIGDCLVATFVSAEVE